MTAAPSPRSDTAHSAWHEALHELGVDFASGTRGEDRQHESEDCATGKKATVTISPTAIEATHDEAQRLGFVVSELTTNVVKYVLCTADTVHIGIAIVPSEECVTLIFRDDGPGYPEATLLSAQRGSGLNVAANIVCKSLGGAFSLTNDGGAVATIHYRAECLAGGAA
jgi:two-component sensor histidine kinase